MSRYVSRSRARTLGNRLSALASGGRRYVAASQSVRDCVDRHEFSSPFLLSEISDVLFLHADAPGMSWGPEVRDASKIAQRYIQILSACYRR